MKLICDGLDLSEAVLKVVKAVSTKTTNQVLEGIKLLAKEDTLTLTATDLEIAIEKKIKAEIFLEGETVVPGKYFAEFVKKLDKDQIELNLNDKKQLRIKYTESEGYLQTMNVDEFPEISRIQNCDSFSMTQKDFKDIIAKTAFSCSIDDSRPILKGCLFEIENKILTAVSLDGFRLSKCSKKIEDSTTNFKVIIPSRSLNEISRMLDKDEDILKIEIQRNVLKIEIGSTTFITRLLEGEFINYKSIIPTKFVSEVIVNKEMLTEALERASVVTRIDRKNLVSLDIKEKNMSIVSTSDIGNINENINITMTGKDLLISFNSRYFTEALKVIDDEFIKIYFNSAIAPCIITPINSEDYLFLLLPVRINA